MRGASFFFYSRVFVCVIVCIFCEVYRAELSFVCSFSGICVCFLLGIINGARLFFHTRRYLCVMMCIAVRYTARSSASFF